RNLMEVALATRGVVAGAWHDHIVVLACAIVRIRLILIIDDRALDLLELDVFIPGVLPRGVWYQGHLGAIAIGLHLKWSGTPARIQVIHPLAASPLRILDEGLLHHD